MKVINANLEAALLSHPITTSGPRPKVKLRSEKFKSESERMKIQIVSPHYNLRTTVALLPHYQHTMWTQPECVDVNDDDVVVDDDVDDIEDYHELENQPLHLHGLHGSLHDKKPR